MTILELDAVGDTMLVEQQQGITAVQHRLPNSNLRPLARENLLRRVRRLFQEIDVNGDGSVSEYELMSKLRSDKEVQAMILAMGRSDTDIFGQLDDDGKCARPHPVRTLPAPCPHRVYTHTHATV